LENEIKSVKGEKIESLPNATVCLDFIALSPADEVQQIRSVKKTKTRKESSIFIPRDVAYYCDNNEDVEDKRVEIIKVPAYIPSNYISDYGQRTEIYRKIGIANSIENLTQIEKEIQDRFGVLPAPVKFYWLF
jgi:hypothetical protein